MDIHQGDVIIGCKECLYELLRGHVDGSEGEHLVVLLCGLEKEAVVYRCDSV